MEQDILNRPLLDVCPMPDFKIEIEEEETHLGPIITFRSDEGYAKMIRLKGQNLAGFKLLEVSTEYRERGVGKLLVQALFNYCLENGINAIEGLVSPLRYTDDDPEIEVSMAVLEKVYSDYGFEIVKRRGCTKGKIKNLQAHFADKLGEYRFN